MIDEMMKSEPQWKNLPSAARNRILLKKWKDQAQVSGMIYFSMEPLGEKQYSGTRYFPIET